VVNPEGPKQWFRPATDTDKIVGFMRQLLAVYPIDPKRTHVTGFSIGAAMSW